MGLMGFRPTVLLFKGAAINRLLNENGIVFLIVILI